MEMYSSLLSTLLLIVLNGIEIINVDLTNE